MSMKHLICGAALGGGAIFFTQHYHIVHHASGLEVVQRTHPAQLSTAYVDVRGWDATQWTDYPDVAEALVAAERSELMLGNAAPLATQAGDALFGTPSDAPSFGVQGPMFGTGGPVLPAQPPIIFDSAQSTSAGMPHGSVPQATMAAQSSAPQAADDSLLGRLARQLQAEQSGTAAPLESRPLERVRETPVFTPSLGVPTVPASVGPDDRAAAAPSQPVSEPGIHPTIQTAVTQRLAAEAQSLTQTESLKPVADTAVQARDFFNSWQPSLPQVAAETSSPAGVATPPAAATEPTYGEIAGQSTNVTQEIIGAITREVLPASNWEHPYSASPADAAASFLQPRTRTAPQLPSSLQNELRSILPDSAAQEVPSWLEPL
ncbi:MAG: hypothetical protein R3B90_14555 [Planctomycetaceae bacterium]